MKLEIRKKIEKALETLGISKVEFSVEYPSDISYGDYTSNVAFIVGKQVGKTTRECAEDIVSLLKKEESEYIAGIDIAGAGFINFQLSRDFFSEKISHILKEGKKWGTNNSWKGKRVIVEYTDPNPFKEFHIGHLFTNTVGEAIARLFMASGAEVSRVNYQGDVGIHVACALWGMQELGFAGARDFTAHELGKAYAIGAAAYTDDEAAKVSIKAINKMVYERSDSTLNMLYDKGKKISLEYFDSIYTLVGTQFDYMFFESEVAEAGKQLVLENTNIFLESDGARVFKGEEYGLHTRVFLNSEGLPTYEAKELALAKRKEEVLGTYDVSIISTANEITEYFIVLKKAMSFIYPELEKKTEHIGHGTVRLSSGKMSSRTGNVISALDFIGKITDAVEKKMSVSTDGEPDRELAQSIAIGAIKYTTLRSNLSQDSIFDIEEALSFEGDSGPYLQYTHARICSVLQKAKDVHITSNTKILPPEVYEVERLVYRFPGIVARANTEREPHQIVRYLTELAGSFNTFYAHEKIADVEDTYAPYKFAVADAVRQTLKNGLWILGIKAPERM